MPKPRVLISTDIGGMDNDDAQSLIHALFYANDLRYVGIVNTRTDDGGLAVGKPRDGIPMIAEIIDAYARDLPRLREVDRDYPTADALRGVVRMGAVDGSFPGQLSDGARHIVSEARKASVDDPLYILTWGPIHDAAAALLSAPDIVPKVRVFSVAAVGQDKKNSAAVDALMTAVRDSEAYDDLWWIDSDDAHKGFYLQASGGQSGGINATLPWVLENARGAGHLGDLLHRKYTYDVHTWQTPASSPDGLKMGDTSSLLYLIDKVSNDAPFAASWGGTFVRTGLGPNTWGDNPAPEHQIGGEIGAGSVARFRSAFLGDYAERLDWTRTGGNPGGGDIAVERVTPDSDGQVRFGGGKIRTATTSEVRGFDFAEGDDLLFVNYNPGTFVSTSGGNQLVVSATGKYLEANTLADLVEVVAASSRVAAAVDLARDVLFLEIDKSTGTHEVALYGYGRAFAELYDAPSL